MNDLRKLKQKLVKVSEKKIKTHLMQRDQLIIRVLALIDFSIKSFNEFFELIEAWNYYYFPELSNLIKENELFLKVIQRIKEKNNIKESDLNDLISDSKLVNEIIVAGKNSLGTNFTQEDLSQLHSSALNALNLIKQRKSLEAYLESLTKEVIPNTNKLIGSMLSARLIAKAGGLEKIVCLPSSTIQVLGAEKALFKHLKSKTKPPKHGIILGFPLLKQLPKEKRGKFARFLSGKILIALKKDFFEKGKELLEEDFFAEVNKRFEEIKLSKRNSSKKQ